MSERVRRATADATHCGLCERKFASAEEYKADTGGELDRLPIGRCWADWHYEGMDDCGRVERELRGVPICSCQTGMRCVTCILRDGRETLERQRSVNATVERIRRHEAALTARLAAADALADAVERADTGDGDLSAAVAAARAYRMASKEPT